MALINGIYVFVQDESVDYALDITSHPVEKGINLSDHARRQPYSLKISGEIVGADAPEKRSQIETLLNTAALITYQGRNIKRNGIIESFSTGHPNNITGGCSFDMTIKEVRTATSSGFIGVIPSEGTQKIEKNTETDEYYTMQNGDTVYEQAANKSSKKFSDIMKLKIVSPENTKTGEKICVRKAINY